MPEYGWDQVGGGWCPTKCIRSILSRKRRHRPVFFSLVKKYKTYEKLDLQKYFEIFLKYPVDSSDMFNGFYKKVWSKRTTRQQVTAVLRLRRQLPTGLVPNRPRMLLQQAQSPLPSEPGRMEKEKSWSRKIFERSGSQFGTTSGSQATSQRQNSRNLLASGRSGQTFFIIHLKCRGNR